MSTIGRYFNNWITGALFSKKNTELSVIDSSLNDAAINNLIDDLKNKSKLERFNFQHNRLNVNNFSKLCDSLRTITALKELNLSGHSYMSNGFKKIQLESLASLVLQNKKLVSLDISDCNISYGYIAFGILVDALINNTSLKHLKLNNCSLDKLTEDLVAKLIAENKSLETLELRNNDFEKDGLVKIIRAVNCNYTLTTLDLRNEQYLGFASEVVDCILDELAINTQLKKVYIYVSPEDDLTISKEDFIAQKRIDDRLDSSSKCRHFRHLMTQIKQDTESTQSKPSTDTSFNFK